jgi:hypothetical protein
MGDLKTFNCEEYNLKIDYLYEILATTFSIRGRTRDIEPNTSCMGIRFIDKNILNICPFPNTRTYKNIKAYKRVGINFVDNVYLYALAALKDPNSPTNLATFPLKYYDYMEIEEFNFPYINEAWLSLFGKVVEEVKTTKRDIFGEIKLSKFKVYITSYIKNREAFQYFNRAQNLALESIILATRLKVAKEIKNNQLFYKIHEKIVDHMENIEKFGKNENALKALELVSLYVSNLMD